MMTQHFFSTFYMHTIESRYSSCLTRMLTFSVIIGPNLKLTVLPAPFISIFVKIFQNIFYSLFGQDPDSQLREQNDPSGFLDFQHCNSNAIIMKLYWKCMFTVQWRACSARKLFVAKCMCVYCTVNQFNIQYQCTVLTCTVLYIVV